MLCYHFFIVSYELQKYLFPFVKYGKKMKTAELFS